MKEVFAAIDGDGSQELSRDEFRSFVTTNAGVEAADADRIFDLLDLDRSGSVSQEEFRKGMRKQSLVASDAGKYQSNESGNPSAEPANSMVESRRPSVTSMSGNSRRPSKDSGSKAGTEAST